MPGGGAGATRSCRSPPAARRCGPAAACAPLPEGHALGIPTRFWPTARSGILGPARHARPRPRRGAAPARRPRADRRPLHRAARGAQARSACRRHAGRSAHRRHPRRFGRRHVRRGDVPAAAGGRPAPGRPHAGAARRGARARPRRAAALLVARRRHGVARRTRWPRGCASAAWTSGSPPRPTGSTGHREDGP